MKICFENNVFLCFLPAYTSHDLQPLDNRVFNAIKTYFRAQIQSYQALSDSIPVDKINFIRVYTKARDGSIS